MKNISELLDSIEANFRFFSHHTSQIILSRQNITSCRHMHNTYHSRSDSLVCKRCTDNISVHFPRIEKKRIIFSPVELNLVTISFSLIESGEGATVSL